MKTIVRSLALAGLVAFGGLGSSKAQAQFFGPGYGGSGLSINIGSGGYGGYYGGYPAVVAPAPVVVAPAPYVVARPFYGGGYYGGGYRPYGGYGGYGPYRHHGGGYYGGGHHHR